MKIFQKNRLLLLPAVLALIPLTAKGRRDTEACFPAFADAVGLFRKGLGEEGVDEEQVLVVLEAVARALGAAVRAP